MEKQTLTVGEVAALIGVSPRTLHDMRQRGDAPKPLPTSKGHPRWSRIEVERWCAGDPRAHRGSRRRQ